jgi:hypothetical protein
MDTRARALPARGPVCVCAARNRDGDAGDGIRA